MLSISADAKINAPGGKTATINGKTWYYSINDSGCTIYGCKGLNGRLTIPSSVENIEVFAFFDCRFEKIGNASTCTIPASDLNSLYLGRIDNDYFYINDETQEEVDEIGTGFYSRKYWTERKPKFSLKATETNIVAKPGDHIQFKHEWNGTSLYHRLYIDIINSSGEKIADYYCNFNGAPEGYPISYSLNYGTEGIPAGEYKAVAYMGYSATGDGEYNISDEENAVTSIILTNEDNNSVTPLDGGKNLEWEVVDGKSYWYENNVRQGTESDSKCFSYDGTLRGREIYDPASDGWYWLDVNADGAKAVGKEVFMPYIYQNEAEWKNDENELNNNAAASGAYAEGNYEHAELAEQVRRAIQSGTGKWVRYDNDGKMLKGWVTIEGDLAVLYPDQAGNRYYYDRKTGLMAKGATVIDGIVYYFDEITRVLK